MKRSRYKGNFEMTGPFGCIPARLDEVVLSNILAVARALSGICIHS